MSKQLQQPYQYRKGDKVRDIHTGKTFIVSYSYWQNYDGLGDYTVSLEATEEQPTPWNQSRNLEIVAEAGVCPACDVTGEMGSGCPACPGFWYVTEAEATLVNATLDETPLPDEQQDAT